MVADPAELSNLGGNRSVRNGLLEHRSNNTNELLQVFDVVHNPGVKSECRCADVNKDSGCKLCEQAKAYD